MVYIGYLKSEKEFNIPTGIKQKYKSSVLVNISGINEGYKVIKKIIQTAKHFSNSFFITTGPRIDKKDLLELNKLSESYKNIEIHKFLDIDLYLKLVDFYITTSGYNSSVEAVTSEVKTLFIPDPNGLKEQLFRAKIFTEKLTSSCSYLLPESSEEKYHEVISELLKTNQIKGNGLEGEKIDIQANLSPLLKNSVFTKEKYQELLKYFNELDFKTDKIDQLITNANKFLNFFLAKLDLKKK